MKRLRLPPTALEQLRAAPVASGLSVDDNQLPQQPGGHTHEPSGTAADRARAARESQGLPATVEDPAVLARVAALLRAAAVVHEDGGQHAG